MPQVPHISDYTTPTFRQIEDFLMSPVAGQSEFERLDLSKYQTDHFQYRQCYMKEGRSRFIEMTSAILKHKPNWVRFVIEYVGFDVDPITGERTNSVFKLSHLMNARTTDWGCTDDQAAHRMVGTLIGEFARQYCRQHGILTYPNPRPGHADTTGFAMAFADLIEKAKADGAVQAGQGI